MAGEKAPLGQDIQQATAGLGITQEELEMYMAGGGTTGTAMYVYEGPDEPVATARRKTGPGMLARAAKPIMVDVTTPDKKRTVDEYYKDFYKKAPGQLSPLQQRLYDAGFYDASMSWEDVRKGDWDADTEQAYRRAVDRAAAFYEAGQKLTLDQVIDQSIQARMQDPNAPRFGKTTGAGVKKKPTIQVTHPDDIRTTAMKVSSNILGRGWSDEELNKFVMTYQQMERAAQQSAIDGGTSVQQPSMQAAAESAARRSNPIAAEGMDIVNAYDMMLKAINELGAA